MSATAQGLAGVARHRQASEPGEPEVNATGDRHSSYLV
jgi:hypothetical protein